jgi:MFS family permease
MVDSGQSKRNLYILWLGVFIAAASFSLVMPFLPQFIEQLGVGGDSIYTWSGWTYAISFVASAIMSPIWGNLADRYGRKPMIIRSGISIGTVYLFMSICNSPYQLFGLRILNGAMSGFIPSSIALVATNTPEESLARALALIQTASAAGTILGPMLGGSLNDLFGMRETMVIGAVILFAASLLVAFGVKERVRLDEGAVRTSPIQDLKVAFKNRTLFALMVAAMLINASIQTLEPILTKFVPMLHQEAFLSAVIHAMFGRADASSFLSGFIFALPAIATLLTAARWARIGEHYGFAQLLAIGLALAGLLVLPQSLVTTAGMLILLRFLYGVMTAAVQPAINATLAVAVHPSFRGRAYGINQSANYMGAVIGPALSGYVADWFGPRAVFVFTGVMLLVSAIWVRRELSGAGTGEQVGAPAA